MAVSRNGQRKKSHLRLEEEKFLNVLLKLQPDIIYSTHICIQIMFPPASVFSMQTFIMQLGAALISIKAIVLVAI